MCTWALDDKAGQSCQTWIRYTCPRYVIPSLLSLAPRLMLSTLKLSRSRFCRSPKLYLAGNVIFYATPSPRCIPTLFSFLPTHRFYNNLFRLRLSSLPLRATNNELFLSWWGFRLKFHSSAKTRKVNVLCTQYSVLLPSFSIRSENKR